MLEVLDGRASRRWARSALAALGDAREELDALNVYPVPDGDTGTNLYLTFEAACSAVTALPADAELRAAGGTGTLKGHLNLSTQALTWATFTASKMNLSDRKSVV